jgi:tail fiber protein gp53
MANLIDNPAGEWTDNEIYEIASADLVEGAASGASFGGIGIDNQPHQQLANRTAFLKGRQDTNIANIGVLQAFVAKFVSLLAANGFIKIPVVDQNLGAQVVIIQWGTVTGAFADEQFFTLNWPTPFPTACLNAVLSTLIPGTSTPDNFAEIVTGSITKTGCRFCANGTGGEGGPMVGFTWIAIGY